MAASARTSTAAVGEGRGEATRLALIHAASIFSGRRASTPHRPARRRRGGRQYRQHRLSFRRQGRTATRLRRPCRHDDPRRRWRRRSLRRRGARLTPTAARALLGAPSSLSSLSRRASRGAVDRPLRRARDVRAPARSSTLCRGLCAHPRSICIVWAAATGGRPTRRDQARHAGDARPGPLLPRRSSGRAAPLGWIDIGHAEAEDIRAVLVAHLDAAIAAARGRAA